MALTFGEIRKLVAPYAGRAGLCPEDAEVARFSRLVMETLLYSGSNAGVRRLNILACKGCIALPPEVEVPLKARIDHQVANIWDKWFTFHSVNEDLDRNCRPAGEVMMEDGDFTPIAYPLPPNGSQIGVMGLCKESEDASVIIQGKDTTGHPIFTMWKGEQIGGEKIAISKGVIKYGQVKFGSIDAVLKSKTLSDNNSLNLLSLARAASSSEWKYPTCKFFLSTLIVVFHFFLFMLGQKTTPEYFELLGLFFLTFLLF